MKRSYSWAQLNRLAAGRAGFIRLQPGQVFRLGPVAVRELPTPLVERLVLDGFDLTRVVFVTRDPEMFDGFAFEQEPPLTE